MASLSEPSRELAAKVLRKVTYDDRLAGFRLSAMAGNVPQDLYSLEETVNFLRMDPWERLVRPGAQGQVCYIDLSVLSRWVAEVLGDAELAEAIRTAIATEEVYAKQVGPVKDLLGERLAQCRTLLEEAPGPSAAGAPSPHAEV